jgi:GNAT superfamily N-acetyltransferase
MKPLAPGYQVVAAAPGDLVHLPHIERAASALFPPDLLPEALRQSTVPMEQLEDALARGSLWVARASDGTPVGFAMGGVLEGLHMLMELDVLPAHGQRGVGHRLMSEAVAWARRTSAPALFLTTFADVPWNAPMYARAGFAALQGPQIPPALQRLLALESRMGLRGRVAMSMVLDPVVAR